MIHDQWELSWAWPGLMQLISIFITPTSCAYDILDLPRHAKSTLSLYCCLLLRRAPFSLHFLSWSLTLFLSLLMLNLTIVPPPSLRAQQPHYLDTLRESCQSVNQFDCGLEVRVNLLRPT